MPVKFEFDSGKVSYHAVARYVERFLGCTVEGMGATSLETAQLYAAAAGASIEQIQRQIYTPATAAAISLGLPEFTLGEMTIRCRGGVITTVIPRNLPSPKPLDGRRMRVLTEAENRRWLAKRARRLRGQPSPYQTDGD